MERNKEIKLAYGLANNYFKQIKNTFAELLENYSVEEMENIAELFSDRLIELITQDHSMIDNGAVN
ncbi:MAG: hypothetical protein MJZ34_11205 [Paludibacteraceae bacterium]|nr:hypothetical protein [Paludibacteraceae bacterium]